MRGIHAPLPPEGPTSSRDATGRTKNGRTYRLNPTRGKVDANRPTALPAAASGPRAPPSASDAPLRRLGKVELLGVGAAFVAPAFSLAAIFALLALKGGRYAWVGVVLGTLAVLLTGACFARMTARHPKAGGAYALVGAELSLPVGFIAGWALCLLYLLGPAIPLLLFVTLLEVFVPQTAGVLVPIAAAVAIGVFVLNAFGLRPSSRVALAVFVAEAAILLGVAVALFLQPAAPLPAPPATLLDTLIALGGSGGGAVFLFLGFESVSAYAEEARLPDPGYRLGHRGDDPRHGRRLRRLRGRLPARDPGGAVGVVRNVPSRGRRERAGHRTEGDS